MIASILKAKYPEINFPTDVLLQDDGDGPYIKQWNLPGSCPTEKDLSQWANELELIIRQQHAVNLRTYPSIGDQLDMIYKDRLNKTNVWETTISSIKSAFPKPKE